jgi:hypothetical protein
MDRVIVYPGTVPQDGDILSTNKNAMISDAFIMQSIFGLNTVAAGLNCTPGTGLSVVIGPGTLNQVLPVDATAYGSLAADTSDALVKTGINLSPTVLALSAPVEAGTSINYLIQAQFVEQDENPITLPYFDAANPTVPYTGPLNGGGTNNTVRRQFVQLQTAANVIAAPSGTQTTPAADTGFVGLWVVTVAAGQTAISGGNITQYAGAPFAPFLLQHLRPGFSSQRVFPASATWQVPAMVNLVRLRIWGGGGAGGGGGGYVGGGGAGGEYVEAVVSVTSGASYVVTIGAGGAAGIGSGSAGGNSSFGALATATGGGGGGAGNGTNVGVGGDFGGSAGLSTAVQGDPIILSGVGGGNGLSFGTAGVVISGTGGGSGYSGTGAPVVAAPVSGSINGQSVTTPGCGGSGGIGSGTGGTGANGLIVVEW